MGNDLNGNNDNTLTVDIDSDSDLEENSETYKTEKKKNSATNSTDNIDDPEMIHLNDITEVRQSLAALQDLFEKQIVRNQNQTEMFDKFYAEMKDYKESFLLEVLHKPIIHNLIQLYDSFVVLESQFDEMCNGNNENMTDALSQYRKNLENFRYILEEVLYRMDVTPYTESLETLDRQLHKTRRVISSDDPEQDRKIAEVHKIGFNWRGKVFRPEEVTIYRYNSTAQKSDDNVSLSSFGKKGGTPNG